jgi:hypothetical protein
MTAWGHVILATCVRSVSIFLRSHEQAIVQGHPDSLREHLGSALAAAYGDGARAVEHDVKCIEVAKLAFPVVRTAEEFFLGRKTRPKCLFQKGVK